MRSKRLKSRSKLQRTKSKIGQVQIACEECKNTISIRSPKIRHKQRLDMNDGRSIFVTYFDCPSCGKCNVVQVDDNDTLELLDKVTKLFVSGQQSAEYKKVDETMQFKRSCLMRRYHDEIVEMMSDGQR